MENYDSIYSIALAIGMQAEIDPIQYDSSYSIAKAIYAKLGGTETTFDSTYSIVYAIYLLQGGVEQHFDSTYSILVAIDKMLGGTGEQQDVYSVLLDILENYSPVPVPTTYTVTYVGNGGEGTMTDPNSPYESGSTVTILDNSYTYSGYTFENWNTASDGTGTDYATGATFTITGNTTLYAQWEEVPVELPYVTFKGLSDGSTIGLTMLSSNQTLEYSTDAETWVGMTTATTLNLDTDDEVYVRGILSADNTSQDYTQFTSTGSVNASGNLNNIWDYNNNGADLQLKAYCGRRLFYSCSGITFTDITLPSENLSGYCYQQMFRDCSGMTVAPELPATTLTDYCYGTMFRGCTALTQAPVLPATTLATYCYYSMFYGCTNLTTAPVLPATTLEERCYYYMFNGCTSLTQAPVLPATTLANYCYQGMFNGCTSLTTAPELPATTLANYCYSSMFYGCTGLTTAPVLSATTLASSCYSNMFQGCNRLSLIICYAEDITAQGCTQYWVNGVAANGYFSGSTLAGWTRGVSGIPNGWETNAIPQYTVTYVGNGGEGTMTDPNSPYDSGSNVTILDNAYTKVGYTFEGWNTAADGSGTSYTTGSTFTITGDTILYAQWEAIPTYTVTYVGNGGEGSMTDPNSPYYVGSTVTILDNSYTYSRHEFVNWNTAADGSGTDYATGSTFTITGNTTLYAQWVEAYVMITAQEDNVTVGLRRSGNLYTNTYQYSNDGETWSNLTTATTITLTNSGDSVYVRGTVNSNISNSYYYFTIDGMVKLSGYANAISNYTNINGTVPYGGCRNLFMNCTGITDASELKFPKKGLGNECYNTMFYGCTSLTQAPALPATTLTQNCYASMFRNCTSLTTAPILPAATLQNSSYNSMFTGCSNLSSITCLATNKSAAYCTSSWVDGVAAIGTFYKNANMSGWTTGRNGIPSGWTVQDYQP